jgi:hypothetical protein
MKVAGVIVVIGGWLLATVVSLQVASLRGKLALTVVGIAVTLYGLIGLLNRAHLKTAIWKGARTH